MKEIVNKILDVVIFIIPFFGKRKHDKVVKEVRYNSTLKETCNLKTTERERNTTERKRNDKED